MTEELQERYKELSHCLEEMGYVDLDDRFMKEINDHRLKYASIFLKEYHDNALSHALHFNLVEGYSASVYDFLFRINYAAFDTKIIVELIEAFEEFGKHELGKNIVETYSSEAYYFRFEHFGKYRSKLFIFTQDRSLSAITYKIHFLLGEGCFISKPEGVGMFVNIKDVNSIKDWRLIK